MFYTSTTIFTNVLNNQGCSMPSMPCHAMPACHGHGMSRWPVARHDQDPMPGACLVMRACHTSASSDCHGMGMAWASSLIEIPSA